LRDAEASGSATPFSDTESRGRKVKKGKSKMADYESITPASSKRKRGLKSMSVTPSINEDEDEDRDSVMVLCIGHACDTEVLLARNVARQKQLT
jgi:ATP-dependent helicase STH1/SNF2